MKFILGIVKALAKSAWRVPSSTACVYVCMTDYTIETH